jgi:hypothetical protein
MTDTEAVKEKVELAQKHIAYQRQLIVGYKKLIVQLERDNKQDLLPAARQLLRDFERVLAGMMVEQVRARDELAKTTTEQKSLAKAQAAGLSRLAALMLVLLARVSS